MIVSVLSFQTELFLPVTHLVLSVVIMDTLDQNVTHRVTQSGHVKEIGHRQGLITKSLSQNIVFHRVSSPKARNCAHLRLLYYIMHAEVNTSDPSRQWCFTKKAPVWIFCHLCSFFALSFYITAG